MRRFERSQEKQSIEEGGGRYHYEQLPNNVDEKRGNVMMANWPRRIIGDIHCNIDMKMLTNFKQDQAITKKGYALKL